MYGVNTAGTADPGLARGGDALLTSPEQLSLKQFPDEHDPTGESHEHWHLPPGWQSQPSIVDQASAVPTAI